MLWGDKPWAGGGVEFFPYAVGTAGNGGFPAGALFLGRNRGKNTKGKVVGSVWAWPAASKTNASWPAHQLGRAGEVVC